MSSYNESPKDILDIKLQVIEADYTLVGIKNKLKDIQYSMGKNELVGLHIQADYKFNLHKLTINTGIICLVTMISIVIKKYMHK